MSTHLAIPFLGLVLVDNTNPERLARACAEEALRVPLHRHADPAGRLDGRSRAPARDLLDGDASRGEAATRDAADARQPRRAPGPRSKTPGVRPVVSPFSRVTCPLTTVTAIPSAF